MNRLLSSTLIISSLLFLMSCGSSSKNSKNHNKYKLRNIEVNSDSDSQEAGALQTIYFPFNSSELRMKAQESLEANAEFLKEYSTLRVQVEGHCDERGSVQYNLALGERRAESIKDYLVASGVDPSRITTISFGKERPVSLNHDEVAWSKNRRGNFVVTGK